VKAGKGRWYVSHAGLLRLARRSHCAGISVEAVPELSDPAAFRWAFKATVYAQIGRAGSGNPARKNLGVDCFLGDASTVARNAERTIGRNTTWLLSCRPESSILGKGLQNDAAVLCLSISAGCSHQPNAWPGAQLFRHR